MTSVHVVGEFVRLNESYDWGGGKYAGKVVRISAVQDEREIFDIDDDDSLIYDVEFVNDHGEVCDVKIPVLPRDIDESYDHYEAQRAAFWGNAISNITGGELP